MQGGYAAGTKQDFEDFAQRTQKFDHKYLADRSDPSLEPEATELLASLEEAVNIGVKPLKPGVLDASLEPEAAPFV